jgi:hypothetical protein
MTRHHLAPIPAAIPLRTSTCALALALSSRPTPGNRRPTTDDRASNTRALLKPSPFELPRLHDHPTPA